MKCKLTNTEGKRVKAHIIPKSFYAIDPHETQPTKLMSNTKGQYTKKCPVGIYDDTIVTEEGERIFSNWDDYASDLLLKHKSLFEPLYHNGRIVAFQISEYDYTKLKLFFLSVLWRASLSTQHFFRKVNLGRHESAIREALLSNDPKDSNWYAVTIAKWSDHPDGVGMMDPYHIRFDGLNYYVMYLKHYIIYYKVDQRIPGNAYQAIQLKQNSPLIAIGRELNESNELKILSGMVKSHARTANK